MKVTTVFVLAFLLAIIPATGFCDDSSKLEDNDGAMSAEEEFELGIMTDGDFAEALVDMPNEEIRELAEEFGCKNYNKLPIEELIDCIDVKRLKK